MTTDANTIPSGLVSELLKGLEGAGGGLLEDVFRTRTDVNQLSGTIPLLDSQDRVRRDENRNLSNQGQAKPFDREMSTISYTCLRQVGAEVVSDANVMEYDGFNEDAIEMGLSGAQREADLYVDLEIESVLTTNANWQTQSAAAVYSDETSAEPLKDIDGAYDQVPGANLLVMGSTVFDEMSKLPSITAEFNNFESSAGTNTSGALDAGQLRNLLLNKYGPKGLEEVRIVEGPQAFYNSANEGESLSKSFIFDEEMWLGYDDAVQVVDPRHELNPQTDQERVGGRSGWELYYTRWIDVVSASSDKGCRFTGI